MNKKKKKKLYLIYIMFQVGRLYAISIEQKSEVKINIQRIYRLKMQQDGAAGGPTSFYRQ